MSGIQSAGGDYQVPNPFHVHENFKTRARNRSSKKEQRIINHYIYQIINICICRFKWTLPREIHPFRHEEYLLRDGWDLFAYDYDAKLFTASKVVLNGDLDIYGYPQDRLAWFINEPPKGYDKTNSVLFQDKPLMYPTFADIRLYAETLAKMWMTRDLNLYALRVPFIASGSEEQMVDFENVMQSYDSFSPFIKVRSSLDLDNNLNVMNTGVTPIFSELGTASRQLKAELMNALGIDAISVEKTERMITGEAEGNKGEVNGARNLYLDIRQRGCKQVNENESWRNMLEEECKCEWNEDVSYLADKFVKGGDPK